jgi:hypothetical protein
LILGLLHLRRWWRSLRRRLILPVFVSTTWRGGWLIQLMTSGVCAYAAFNAIVAVVRTSAVVLIAMPPTLRTLS